MSPHFRISFRVLAMLSALLFMLVLLLLTMFFGSGLESCEGAPIEWGSQTKILDGLIEPKHFSVSMNFHKDKEWVESVELLVFSYIYLTDPHGVRVSMGSIATVYPMPWMLKGSNAFKPLGAPHYLPGGGSFDFYLCPFDGRMRVLVNP